MLVTECLNAFLVAQTFCRSLLRFVNFLSTAWMWHLEVNPTAACHKFKRKSGRKWAGRLRSHFLPAGLFREDGRWQSFFGMHLHFFLSVCPWPFGFNSYCMLVCELVLQLHLFRMDYAEGLKRSPRRCSFPVADNNQWNNMEDRPNVGKMLMWMIVLEQDLATSFLGKFLFFIICVNVTFSRFKATAFSDQRCVIQMAQLLLYVFVFEFEE